MEKLKFIKNGTELLYNNEEYCSAVCNFNLNDKPLHLPIAEYFAKLISV